MNPDTPELATRLEANPALLSGTTSIWMDGGGVEQQQVVAEACIREAASTGEAGGALDAEGLTASLQGLHHAGEQYTVTAPHHFGALLRQCLQLFGSKRADTLEQIDFLQVLAVSSACAAISPVLFACASLSVQSTHGQWRLAYPWCRCGGYMILRVFAVQGGLTKLAEAEAAVDALNSEAEQQRRLLTEKQHEVATAMAAIEDAMEAAGSRKTEVEQLSQQQLHEQQAASKRKVRSVQLCPANVFTPSR